MQTDSSQINEAGRARRKIVGSKQFTHCERLPVNEEFKSFRMRVIVFFLACSASPAAAQLGLQLFTGYVFKETFPVTPVDVQITDGMAYGGGLDVVLGDLYGIEFTYQGQQVEYNVSDDNGINETDEGRLEYIQVSGTRLYPITALTSIFGGLNFGTSIITNSELNEKTYRFGWGGKVGVRHRLSDLLAIKLQTQLMAIMHAEDVSAWPGQTSSSAQYSDYAYALQLGVIGGIVITPFARHREMN